MSLFSDTPIPESIADSSIDQPLTVWQLTCRVKQALAGCLPGSLSVVGELSNFKHHRSGHVYFTLKDARSELACVMWRSAVQYLKFQPKDGLSVVARGNIDVFERTGRYQLYVRSLEPQGTGALELALRQLHDRLSKEGLFDARHKRPLPVYPHHVGVITSSSGAAFWDIIHTIRRRWPLLTVSLLPVNVQGAGAAEEISRGIELLNAHRAALGLDLLIVGRGGGTLEDLWAFNEERLARAIHHSALPIVSAVGHEVDVTISDLVADVRAATPTAAAELIVPVYQQVVDQLDVTASRLHNAVMNRMRHARQGVAGLAAREPLAAPLRLIEQVTQQVDHATSCMEHAIKSAVYALHKELSGLENQLQRIEPMRYLGTVGNRLDRLDDRLVRAEVSTLGRNAQKVENLSQQLILCAPAVQLERSRNRVRQAGVLLLREWTDALRRRKDHLDSLEKQLSAVGYRRTLARGYTVTRLAKKGKMVMSARQVQPGDILSTETVDGAIESTVRSEPAGQDT